MLATINSFAQMYNYETLTATHILTHILLFLGLSFTVKYLWNRRYLYYYASKIPGPFSLPFIGSAQLFFQQENFFKVIINLVQSYPRVSKAWLGPNLYVFSSFPQDIETVLSTCLKKSSFYNYFIVLASNSLIAAPVPLWKEHRRLMNHCFNSKVIDSFNEIFSKYSNDLVKVLNDSCGKEETDLFSKVWWCTMDIAGETLYDISPTIGRGLIKDTMSLVLRMEQIMVERIHTIWLYLEPLWQLSALEKEHKAIEDLLNDYSTKTTMDYEMRKKRLCNHLIDVLQKKGTITRNQINEEVSFAYIAGTETTAATVTSAMLLLGLYPDVQEKVYQELTSIFGDEDRDPTLEDLKRMEYLERVIKETIRLLPALPFIMRSVDKTIQLESCVLPAGCDMLIPVICVHRNPELWPDPLKFDPDRFLPEEVKKRHRCAFIPFSFGLRNCIGFQYAMLSLKHKMFAIVKSFEIKTLDYKSVEDIEIDFHIVAKPKNCKILLERRGE